MTSQMLPEPVRYSDEQRRAFHRFFELNLADYWDALRYGFDLVKFMDDLWPENKHSHKSFKDFVTEKYGTEASALINALNNIC